MNLKELYLKLVENEQYNCPVCNGICELESYGNYMPSLVCRNKPFLANGTRIHFCIIENRKTLEEPFISWYSYINLINGFEIFYKEFYEKNSFKSLFYYNDPSNIEFNFKSGINSGELEIQINFNENPPYIENVYLEKVKNKIKTIELFR